MPNYNLVADTQFKNRSFDDMLKPLLMYTQEYNAIEDAANDLSTKASVWEGMANEQTDPEAYAQYKRYADDLQRQAINLSQNGLNPTTRRELLNLKRRYSSEITPIEQAYANRKTQADEQRKAMLQNPTLLLSRRADMTSLDDYMRNPQLGYESYSGALLTQQVGQAASAIAKELRDYGNGKPLSGFTKTWLQQHGYTAAEVAQAINSPDSPRSSHILNTLVNNVMADSGVPQWADRATLNQAYSYARQGLWNAVGQTQVQTYTDEAAKLAAQEASQKRVARYAAGLQEQRNLMNGLAINPINIYSQKERDQANRNMKQYAKYFTTNADGRVYLNAEGIKEYKRKVRLTNGTPMVTPEGTTILTGVSVSYGDSPFKQFIDSLGGKDLFSRAEVGNLGNLWVQYNKDNSTSNFDATRSTEFDYTISDSQQKDMKKAIQTAARGTKLQEVDFDRKTNTFKPSGDTIDMEDLNSDNVTVLSTRFSPYGNTVMIKDKNGEVHRYSMPTGINPTNEANRDRAMQKAMQWQNMIASGQYTDARGNVHQATPDEITYAQRMYAQALQEAYLYHSQLGISNKIKEQEFNPYGY